MPIVQVDTPSSNVYKIYNADNIHDEIVHKSDVKLGILTIPLKLFEKDSLSVFTFSSLNGVM